MASDNGFCAETEPDIIRSAGGAGPYGTLCDIGLNLLDDMFSGYELLVRVLQVGRE